MIPPEWVSLIQTISVVIAMIVAFGTLRGRDNDKTALLARMQADIEYIKKSVDGYDSMRGELSDAKNSAKSAHKRLDDHLRYDHQKQIERRE